MSRSLWERFDEVLKQNGESVSAFARRSGISDSTLRTLRKRGTMPGADTALIVAQKLGISVEWLVEERGPMRLHENGPSTSSQAVTESDPDLPGFTLVPRLDVKASAGVGLVAYNEDTLDYLAFQEGWLRSRGVNPAAARVITATGDSMEETIRDGDVLLIDTSIDRVKDNAIYVVVYGDLLLVKRVHKRINGSLQLISDNSRYPAEDVAAGEVDLVNIAGRVMWFGRSI